jgi:two-component system, cell cycle response regulator CpdR
MAAILLVDDDPDILNILDFTLTAAGHQVTRAQDGVAALNILDNSKGKFPDLMLTDVIMPGLNGFNLARMARTRNPFLKILYLTGFHEMAITMRDHGDRLGKILMKPIMPDELAKEISETLAETAEE